MALSRPLKKDRLALPLSTPLSSSRSMVSCPWLCTRRYPQLLNTLDLPRSKSLVRVALPAGLSARSLPFPPTCPGQHTHESFGRWMSTIDTFQSGLPIPLRRYLDTYATHPQSFLVLQCSRICPRTSSSVILMNWIKAHKMLEKKAILIEQHKKVGRF